MVPPGDILPRVLVAAVPSGLGTREGTRKAVAAGAKIKDGVDSRATRANADHDCVLIRTHDVGDVVEHD